ncbi:unnamed protein product [Lymnaea stagnalis]|uniref:Vitellogenin domain-containing protein n=1 Tax=Lymnaea stagnalis TaxID=6523 RepID=A0AAV2HCQ3_LYMST
MGSYVLLFLALPAVLGGPVNWPDASSIDNEIAYPRTECSTHCTGSEKYRYEVGKTYRYDYEVTTATSMHGASEDVARIDVKAKVSLQVISKCDMALSLSDVSVMRSDPNQNVLKTTEDWTFKLALEQNSLRFSFQDGGIEELCPEQNEETAVLNFKRGVLSALQNSMVQFERDESLQETDVTGTCPTLYSVPQKGWKSLEITKSKDLLGCVDRDNYQSALKSAPFHVPDTIKSLPLLKGNSVCKQIISKDGYLSSSTCTESLVFRPFSKKESGARTEITQKLIYVTATTGLKVSAELIRSRTNLLFDHTLTGQGGDKTSWSARALLTQLCRITAQDIPAEVPELFTGLVYQMRGLGRSQLTDISDQVFRSNICEDNKEKARKFYLDALPMVGTGSSVQVMVQMLLSGEIIGAQAELWINSLHFIQNPTTEMIAHLNKLLLSEKHRLTSLLPLSSLIKNFCDSNSDCMNDKNVHDILDVFNGYLDQSCQSKDQDLVLAVLRAVGNLGYSDQLAPTLEKCFESTEVSMNVRVFATQAFRGITCAIDRNEIMSTFENKDEDTELRISAYLAVMKCADESVLKQVKRILEIEPVNQVGSFVWTHLTNLMETSSPHKQALRDILDDETLKTEFKMDKRKFSTNYEVSFFSEKFGAGATGESNVVWSSKSFIPRSAMVNLTVDVLGQSINLIEIGGRVQGLEDLLQKYVGSKLFKGGETPKDGGPSRCTKKEKMDSMKTQFDINKEDLTASLYLRMFGNELAFQHFTEKQLLSLKDKIADFNFFKSSGDEISFTKSFMFLESKMTVPTIAGISLTLGVNGTATADLQAKVTNERKRLKTTTGFNISPRQAVGAIQVSGLMSLNVGPVSAGLKMVTTLHTSTAVSGRIEVDSNQVLSVDIDTPKKNMDILTVQSEFFVVHNNVEKKQKMLQERKMKAMSCSPEQVFKVTGYQFCGAVSYVNASTNENAPYFPFTGPMLVSVTVEKKDAPKGFKLDGKKVQNENASTGMVSVDTPSSSVIRAISIGYYLDKPGQSLELELVSPWKNILLKGSYPQNSKSREFNALATVDGKDYKFIAKIDRDIQKGKTVWTPTLEFSQPKDSKVTNLVPELLSVSGTVEVHERLNKNIKTVNEIRADLELKSGLKADPVLLSATYINRDQKQKTLTGTVTLDKNKKNVYTGTVQLLQSSGDVKSGSQIYEPTVLVTAPNWRIFLLSGTIDFKEDKFLKGDIQVTMEKTLQEPINLNVSATKSVRGSLQNINFNASLKGQFGTIKSDGQVKLSTASGKGKKAPLMTTMVNVDYNLPMLLKKELSKNRLTLNSKLRDKSKKSARNYLLEINMNSKNYPSASFEADFDITHKNSSTVSKITLKHGPKTKTSKKSNPEIKLEMSVDHKINPGSAMINYDFLVIYPPKEIEYQLKGKHEHQLNKNFKLETYTNFIYSKGKSVEFRLMGSDNSQKSNMAASGLLQITIPAFEIDGKKVDGRSYKIVTNIAQSPDKEYTHTISLQLNNNEKHSLVTKFKRSKEDFSFLSQMQVNGEFPSKMTLKAVKKPQELQGMVAFQLKDDVYSVGLNVTGTMAQYQAYSWDLTVPDRTIQGALEAGQKNRNEGLIKFHIRWDAAKDPSQKIETEFSVYNDNENGLERWKHRITFNFTSPFKNHKIYTFKRLSEVDKKELKDELKLVWGLPENEISYFLRFRTPFSLESFETEAVIITPWSNLRKLKAEVAHKFDGSRYLSSNWIGMYNDHYMSVALLLKFIGDKNRNALVTSIGFNSSIPACRTVGISLSHNNDGRNYITGVSFERNGQSYLAKFNATYVKTVKQLNIESNLVVSIPSDEPLIIRLTHSNTAADFNSTVTLSWRPQYNTRAVLGGKFDSNWKDYAVDIVLSSSWTTFSGFELQFRHNMLNEITGSGYLRTKTSPSLVSTLTYTSSKLDLVSSYDLHKTTMKGNYLHFPYTLLFEHIWHGDFDSRYGQNRISLDASLNKNEDNEVIGSLNFITPWEKVRNIDVRSTTKKISDFDWRLNSVISLDTRKKIEVEGEVDPIYWNKLGGTITTPYSVMSKLSFANLRAKSEKTWYWAESYLEVQPYFNTVKMEQNTTWSPSIIGSYRLDLPGLDMKYLKIDLTANETRRGVDADVTAKYHPDKSLDLKLRSKFNKNRFPVATKVSVDLATPFDALPSLKVDGDINKEKDNWITNLKMESGVKEQGYVNMRMQQSLTDQSYYSDLDVSSSVFETVAAGIHLDWGDTLGANLTIKAPSVGRKVVGFKKVSKSWTNFQNRIFGDNDGQELDMDMGLKHDDQETRAWLTYAYPGSDHSYLKSSVHRVGDSASDFDVGGFLQVGRDSNPYNISVQYAFVEMKSALGTTLETPFSKSLSFYLNRELKSPNENSVTVYGKYGIKYLIDFYTSSKLEDSQYSYTLRNEHLFDGAGTKLGTNILTAWNSDKQSFNGEMKNYYNEKWIRIEVDKERQTKEKVPVDIFDVNFFSEFKDFKDVGLHAELKNQSGSYNGYCSLEYMDEKSAILNFDLSSPSKNRHVLNGDLILPVAGYEYNTLVYKQLLENDEITADVQVVTGSKEQVGGKFKYKNSEILVTVTGPVKEFEFLHLSGKYDAASKQVLGKATLKLTLDNNPAELVYNISQNGYAPLVANVKLNTPYQNLRSLNLNIEHEFKNWTQVKTTSKLQLENFGDVNTYFSVNFVSPLDMEVGAKLTSPFENFENLKLAVKTKESKLGQESQLNVGWRPEKEITLNTAWSLRKGPRTNKLSSQFELSSPFPNLQTAKFKLDHSSGPNMINENIIISQNGVNYVDADLSYKYGDKHAAVLEMRKPNPLSISLTGLAETKKLDGNLKLNWDTLSKDSNIEVIAYYEDRSGSSNVDNSFKLKVIHPVRIMGIECHHKWAEKELSSSSLLTWDQQNANTFAYDINFVNYTSRYNQKYEGHIKLGVPQRSVKVQGSYSDTGSSVITTSAFMWDADKDDKKVCVTLTTEVESTDNLKRVGLNINLPSINKQLNLSGTTKINYGSTLIDSNAEISYSSDPQKTIVVKSVIKNLEPNSKNNYNYTADVTFEHPITNTNLQLTSHFGSVGKICSAATKLLLLTTSKERKSLEFWSSLDRANQQMVIKVATPIKTIALYGQAVDYVDRKIVRLTSTEEDKETLNLYLSFNQRTQDMLAEFNYDRDDPKKLVRMTGRLVNDTAIRVDLMSQNGVQTSEGMLTVRLNTSEILHTRILWRPAVFSEIQNFLGTKVTSFSYATNDVFATSVDTIGSDVKSRYLLISRELGAEMNTVFQLMEGEMKIFNNQLDTFRVEIRRFYQRNDLYIRDLGEHINKTFIQLLSNIQVTVQSYSSYYARIRQATQEFSMVLKTYPVAQKYAMSVEELVSALKRVRAALEMALEETTKELEKFSHLSYRKYLEISRSLDTKLQSYTLSLLEHPLNKKLMKQMASLRNKGMETFPQWIELYTAIYTKGQQLLQDQFHDMMARQEFQYGYAVANEIHQQVKYWNMEQGMNMLTARAIDLSKNLLLLELAKLKKTLENSRVIVYDPERGELQFEIHLPVPVKSFTEAPALNVNSYINSIQQWTKVNLPNSTPNFWDTYYHYVPSIEPSSWIPPFDASGYVIGSQHYFTFDKTHHDFLSSCSVVLTRDILNDNFSVVLNYEKTTRRNRKSLCFNIENNLNFDISDDYKLKVENRDTEMPFSTEKVKVVRDGDFIRVTYTGGLEVLSNPKLDLYKVTVQGWYHGRVAGLLGHYDNEPSTDVTTNKNYEVDRKQCNNNNLALTQEQTLSKDDKCRYVFQESRSKFRPCFKQVDPTPFIHMCKSYQPSMTEDDAIHRSTEQYRFMCEEHGIYMGALDDYVPCSNEEPTIVDGTDPLYQSADVLFVVEDNTCNEWATRSLTNIVTEINKVLDTAGLKNNRFGLESFGGYDGDEAVRTINGQHFGEASLFLKALETLRFMNNETHGNILTAMRMALSYPYRTGVAKVIIIAPCTTCEVSYLQKLLMSSNLQSQGFIVHVLQKQNFRPIKTSSGPKKYKIYGVDNVKSFTNMNDEGDENMLATTDIRSDDCHSLAQTTQGAIFDVSHLNDKPKVQQDFIKSFASQVGLTTKVPSCQNCECNIESGQVECQLCESNLITTIALEPPNLPKFISSINDFSYDVKTYFGLA